MANPAFHLDGGGDGTSTASAGDTTKDSDSSGDEAGDDAEGTSASTANPATGDDAPSDATGDDPSDATADSGAEQSGPSSETDGTTRTSDTNATDNTSGESGTSDGTRGDASGTTTGMGMCAIAGITDCGDCMSELCCEQLTACNGAGECACLADCLAGGDPAADCGAICEIAEPPEAWQQLVECVIDNCPDGGECPNAADG